MMTKRRGTGITVKDYENINQAIRRFSKKTTDAKIVKELRDRQFYEKPTTARKKKKKAAESRNQKRIKKDLMPPKYY